MLSGTNRPTPDQRSIDYDVQYSASETGPWDTHEHAGAGRRTTITGLQPETTYWVRIRASNDEGISDWSDSAQGITGQTPVSPVPPRYPFPRRLDSDAHPDSYHSDLDSDAHPDSYHGDLDSDAHP